MLNFIEEKGWLNAYITDNLYYQIQLAHMRILLIATNDEHTSHFILNEVNLESEYDKNGPLSPLKFCKMRCARHYDEFYKKLLRPSMLFLTVNLTAEKSEEIRKIIRDGQRNGKLAFEKDDE